MKLIKEYYNFRKKKIQVIETSNVNLLITSDDDLNLMKEYDEKVTENLAK